MNEKLSTISDKFVEQVKQMDGITLIGGSTEDFVMANGLPFHSHSDRKGTFNPVHIRCNAHGDVHTYEHSVINVNGCPFCHSDSKYGIPSKNSNIIFLLNRILKVDFGFSDEQITEGGLRIRPLLYTLMVMQDDKGDERLYLKGVRAYSLTRLYQFNADGVKRVMELFSNPDIKSSPIIASHKGIGDKYFTGETIDITFTSIPVDTKKVNINKLFESVQKSSELILKTLTKMGLQSDDFKKWHTDIESIVANKQKISECVYAILSSSKNGLKSSVRELFTNHKNKVFELVELSHPSDDSKHIHIEEIGVVDKEAILERVNKGVTKLDTDTNGEAIQTDLLIDVDTKAETEIESVDAEIVVETKCETAETIQVDKFTILKHEDEAESVVKSVEKPIQYNFDGDKVFVLALMQLYIEGHNGVVESKNMYYCNQTAMVNSFDWQYSFAWMYIYDVITDKAPLSMVKLFDFAKEHSSCIRPNDLYARVNLINRGKNPYEIGRYDLALEKYKSLYGGLDATDRNKVVLQSLVTLIEKAEETLDLKIDFTMSRMS